VIRVTDRGSLIALFAKPEYFEDVTFDKESVLLADASLELLNQALVQVHARSAALTDKVVVMLTRLDQLVAAFSVSEVYRLNQTHSDKRLE
jgi:hypothetical protein